MRAVAPAAGSRWRRAAGPAPAQAAGTAGARQRGRQARAGVLCPSPCRTPGRSRSAHQTRHSCLPPAAVQASEAVARGSLHPLPRWHQRQFRLMRLSSTTLLRTAYSCAALPGSWATPRFAVSRTAACCQQAAPTVHRVRPHLPQTTGGRPSAARLGTAPALSWAAQREQCPARSNNQASAVGGKDSTAGSSGGGGGAMQQACGVANRRACIRDSSSFSFIAACRQGLDFHEEQLGFRSVGCAGFQGSWQLACATSAFGDRENQPASSEGPLPARASSA